MKKITLLLFITLFSQNVLSDSLSGTVDMEKSKISKISKGVLYIFAKKFGSKSKMPIVVKKITGPEFPVKFKLTKSDTMVPNTPFKGPFIITARLSPSGGVMDKSGLEAKTKKPISLGTSGIILKLE